MIEHLLIDFAATAMVSREKVRAAVAEALEPPEELDPETWGTSPRAREAALAAQSMFGQVVE